MERIFGFGNIMGLGKFFQIDIPSLVSSLVRPYASIASLGTSCIVSSWTLSFPMNLKDEEFWEFLSLMQVIDGVWLSSAEPTWI